VGDAFADGVGEFDTDAAEALGPGQCRQRVCRPAHPRGPVRRTWCHTQAGEQVGA
jgi:hypothetical protein